MTENDEKEVRKIRCSALNTAENCVASLATAEDAEQVLMLPPNVDTPQSKLGTAFHHVAALSTAGVLLDAEKVTEAARQFACDPRELHWLWSRAENELGAPDRVWVEHPVSIVASEGLVITGTLDRAAYWSAGQVLQVDDWKTGRLAIEEDPDAPGHAQLLAYGTGMVGQVEATEKLEVSLLEARLMIVRTRQSSSVTLDKDGIEEELEATLTLARKADSQRREALISRDFTVGAHCRFCRGRGICPAYRETMIQALAVLDPPDIEPALVPLTKKGAPNKKELAKLVKIAIQERVDGVVRKDPERAFNIRILANRLHEGLDLALKEYVEFMGPIDAGPDHELAFRPFSTKGQVTRDVVVEAAKFMEIEASELNKLLDGIDNRPKIESKRFGRFKK